MTTMSKAITEKKPEGGPPDPFQPSRETAPSVMAPDEPRVARWVGTIGLTLVALGAISLFLQLGLKSPRGINLFWAIFFIAAGLGGLLFHAVSDKDLQVRRTYGMLGYFLLAAAILITVMPYKGVAGALFLPWGLLALALGLLFLLPFVRNEDEPQWRDMSIRVLGTAGAILALVGLIGGSVSNEFLLQYSPWLVLLGFFTLMAFVVITDTATDLGYWSGLGIGLAGLAVFLVALGRSVLPPLFYKWGWSSPPPPLPYFVPYGLLLMSFGLGYMGLSAALCSDSRLVAMTRREVTAYFYSPIAYIVLFGMTIGAGLSYLQFVASLVPQGEGLPQPTMIEPIVLRYFFGIFPVLAVLVIVPIVTMRLLSEEKRTGTYEVLMTAPVTEATVVLSKFFAALIFFSLLWAPWWLFLLALWLGGGQAFDYLPLLSFLVVLACTGAGFLGMGLFFSSLTRNQIAAAVLSFAGMLALTFPWFIRQLPGLLASDSGWVTVFQHISYLDLWLTSLEGKLPPQDLVIQLSAAVFWLFLTTKVLEARKWS
jgi:ABC-type transport system involved in multi-copper enzyme maturation permease subunit